MAGSSNYACRSVPRLRVVGDNVLLLPHALNRVSSEQQLALVDRFGFGGRPEFRLRPPWASRNGQENAQERNEGHEAPEHPDSVGDLRGLSGRR